MVILKALKMKVRWINFRAVLLVLVVSPTALLAMPRMLGAPSCHAADPHIRRSYKGRSQATSYNVVTSLPGHHGPATRLHRVRGKKISVQGSFLAAQGCSSPCRYRFGLTLARPQDPDGPNPSRGPPSQSL